LFGLNALIRPPIATLELQQLAEDIGVNGLREPLVIAKIEDRGVELIDGRNRREACKIAGVKEPATRMLNGEDATAFVLSANVHRRNITSGQRAMAIAMLYPNRGVGGRGKKNRPDVDGLARQRIADARAVLSYSEELASAVMSGQKPLQAALNETKQSQGDLRNERKRRLRLKEERPDLADLVESEAMTLDDAVQRAKAEAEALKQQRWAATMEIIDGIRPFDRDTETAAENLSLYDSAVAESRGETVTPTRIRRAAEYLLALAAAMECEK
jgi:ParB-like chromosome segregation protein Spo0J